MIFDAGPVATIKYARAPFDWIAVSLSNHDLARALTMRRPAYTVPERFNGYTAAPARVTSDMQVIYYELKKRKK